MTSIRSVRAEIIARTDLTGPALRAELTTAYDSWLAGLIPDRDGLALVAVGGLGRGEPTLFSDLDLVLLHSGRVAKLRALADQLWYPIWDSRLGLDHSVRTVEQAVDVAGTDLKAMLGMLDARHVAGDRALSARLHELIIARWLRDAPNRLPELQQLARSRWRSNGDASFLLEPDLKDCRGGLRDWVGLRALASAQLLDIPQPAIQARDALLDIRGELHRLAGRQSDVLRGQDRSGVARALGLPGADAALRSVNEAARTIGYATDAAWRRVAVTEPAGRSWVRRLQRGRVAGADSSDSFARPGAGSAAGREPLAADVVAQGGEVVLARDARPASDPVLVLRVARVAAQHDLPIAVHTLHRIATECPPLPQPWPAQARTEFVTLLGAGRQAVNALEALNQHGLLSRLLPEWETVRFKAQHNPVHLFTVDRHLIETAVHAGQFAGEVARPDLLLIGAFLHDIGKGYPGDHSIVGAEVTSTIVARMGYHPADADTLTAMTRHHLLLPDTATRRDIDDPSTVQIVLSAIGGSVQLLELLHYLSIADAAATGPAAWSDWKAGLLQALVRSCRAVLGGQVPPPAEPAPTALLHLAAAGQPSIVRDETVVSVVASDRPGLLSCAAGLLALHSLDVQSAQVRTVNGMAINSFVVSPRFGQYPSPDILQADLRRVLQGSLELDERLRAKAAKYESERGSAEQSVGLRWLDHEATGATILEVRAPDRIGLLHWLTSALEQAGVDIRSARISSLGGHVVDSFYLTDADGQALSPARQQAVGAQLVDSLSGRDADQPIPGVGRAVT